MCGKQDLQVYAGGGRIFLSLPGNPNMSFKELIKMAQGGLRCYKFGTRAKVQDLGADGVVAVSSGAGGHAGPITPRLYSYLG